MPPVELQTIVILAIPASLGFLVFPLMSLARKKNLKTLAAQVRLGDIKPAILVSTSRGELTLAFFLLALLLFVMSIFLYLSFQTYTVWQNGIRKQGVVVESLQKARRKRRGPVRYKTTVRWPDDTTDAYTLRSDYVPGDRITIIRAPDKPRKIYSDHPDDWFDFYIGLFVCVLLSPLLYLIAAPVWRGLLFSGGERLDGKVLAVVEGQLKSSMISYYLGEVLDPLTSQKIVFYAEAYDKRSYLREGDVIGVFFKRKSHSLAVQTKLKALLRSSLE